MSDVLVVDLVAGARPNFVKLAPVARALATRPGLRARIVHTGQHYDAAMSEVFFSELGIAEPEVNLEVGSGTHGAQTARILERYEQHLLDTKPAATVVFGDVNSTVACALAAAKLGIPIVHVEAGLRSFDRTMPEEVNRVLTDALSDLLLVTERSGLEHLRREGIPAGKIQLVGNTMIDTLLQQLPRARERARAKALGLKPGGFGLVTMHRPSNVDDPKTLKTLFNGLRRLSSRLPLVFPVHPRTRQALEAQGLPCEGVLDGTFHLLAPFPYLDNLSLMADAKVVLTDSGGMQEETACLGVPCVTMRENTERPVTLEVGASRLVGSDMDRLEEAFLDVVEGRWPPIRKVPLWDGRAAERIADALEGLLLGTPPPLAERSPPAFQPPPRPEPPAKAPRLRILLMSHYFPPEVNAPAARTYDHARVWAERGHEVHVVTGFPSHPQGRLYPGYTMHWWTQEEVDGIHVHRVATVLGRNAGVVRRTLNYLSYVPSALWRAIRLGRFDVLLATSPQFFCGVAGCAAATLKRTPWVFEVRDLWPESIREVGALKASWALRFLERLETRLYRSADRIVTVSRAFVRRFRQAGVQDDRIAYVPNGVEIARWTVGEDVRAAWRRRLDLPDGAVLASYVGTVGMAHGVGTVLDAAKRLKERAPSVHWVIAGDGAEREALEARAKAEGLSRVRFLGQVPRDDVPGLLAATDISLVLLRNAPLFRTVLPSKMFEAMAAARPILLGVDGEARRVLEESGGGRFVPPEDATALAHEVESLAGDPAARRRLGERGRRHVGEAFDRRRLALGLLQVLEAACVHDPAHPTVRAPVGLRRRVEHAAG